MASEQTVEWPGVSGKRYTYWVHPIWHPLKAEGGNYIFAKIVDNTWSPVYIGQTDNLKDRVGTHEKRQCVIRNSATHIHAHLNGDQTSRLAEETDIRNNFDTPCNEQ